MTPDRLEVPEDPSKVTNGQLMLMLQRVSTKQTLQFQQQQELSKRFDTFESDTRDMRDAWGVFIKMMRFIKYAASIFIALGAVYYAVLGAIESIKNWATRVAE